MPWKISLQKPLKKGDPVRARVEHPSGRLRTATGVSVQAEKKVCSLIYAKQKDVKGGKDSWSLPFTGLMKTNDWTIKVLVWEEEVASILFKAPKDKEGDIVDKKGKSKKSN